MNRIEDRIPELESLARGWDVTITCEMGPDGNQFAVRLKPRGYADPFEAETHTFRAATVRAAVLLAYGG